MFIGAVSLAEQALQKAYTPDLLIATDMLDLAGFLGHTRGLLANIPTILYFHENQITYPWSPDDQRSPQWNNQYGFLNVTSALAADQLWFNSAYHRSSFFTALPDFLQQFPDENQLHRIAALKEKSQVVPLGLNLQALLQKERTQSLEPPLITWNHRWEYDKNPEAFFQVLFQIKEEGLAFRLAVLGEHYRKAPPIFAEAKEKLANQIVHWGYAERETYQRWLTQTDLLPITSRQDFFGGSLVEGMAAGAIPLVPNRLAFPEHIPSQHQPLLVYDSDQELLQRLRIFLKQGVPSQVRSDLRHLVSRYDWSTLAPVYDRGFDALL